MLHFGFASETSFGFTGLTSLSLRVTDCVGLSGYGFWSFQLLFNVNLLEDTSSLMSELRRSIACKILSLDAEYLLLMSCPQTLKQA